MYSFAWDFAKEVENIRKHGISFSEAVEAFQDSDGLQLTDRRHSVVENRFYWIGEIADGRIITV